MVSSGRLIVEVKPHQHQWGQSMPSFHAQRCSAPHSTTGSCVFGRSLLLMVHNAGFIEGPHNGASSFTHVLIVVARMRKGCSLEKQGWAHPWFMPTVTFVLCALSFSLLAQRRPETKGTVTGIFWGKRCPKCNDVGSLLNPVRVHWEVVTFLFLYLWVAQSEHIRSLKLCLYSD